MATRPTGGTLTTAGFTQVSTTTKYTKAQTTATVAVDLAAGTDKTGVAAVQPTAPGTPMTAADFAAGVAVLGQLGYTANNAGGGNSVGPCNNLVYYGQSV